MAANRHAVAVALGDRAVLILGPSGSGKTTLALVLAERARAAGRLGALVADDQVLLERAGDALLARAPPALAGLAERRGPGPLPVETLAAARIDAAVELVERARAPRLETGPAAIFDGVALPRLSLAAGDALSAAIAVEAWRDNGFALAG